MKSGRLVSCSVDDSGLFELVVYYGFEALQKSNIGGFDFIF